MRYKHNVENLPDNHPLKLKWIADGRPDPKPAIQTKYNISNIDTMLNLIETFDRIPNPNAAQNAAQIKLLSTFLKEVLMYIKDRNG